MAYALPVNVKMSAAILAGGKGTRLQSRLPDTPKILAPINNRPFVTYVLDQLIDLGLDSATLCVGYMADQIQQTLGTSYRNLQLRYVAESEPLGTGGALRLAAFACEHEWLLAMNGDSFVATDLSEYVRCHFQNDWPASIVVTPVEDCSRFGRVQVNREGRIDSFAEKTNCSEPGWINGGVYLFPTDWLRELPEQVLLSMERDVLPQWIKRGLHSYFADVPFIDIGLPETFAAAPDFFSEMSRRSS